MKKTKVIIPALGILLLSTAASVTGTVAWFATNTGVTATGMQIRAKSDNTFLLISATNTTAATIQNEASINADLSITAAASKVAPAAPAVSETEVGYLSASSGHKTTAGAAISVNGVAVDSYETMQHETNWYTANAADPLAPDIKVDTVKQLSVFTGYVIQKDVYLTVASGANNAVNLTVSPTFTQLDEGNDLTAARCALGTSDGGFVILSSADNASTVDIKGNNTPLTDSTVLNVKLYFYYDGNAAPVFTKNTPNLKGIQVDLAFDVSAVA